MEQKKSHYIFVATIENLQLRPNTTFDFCSFQISNHPESIGEIPNIEKWIKSLGTIYLGDMIHKTLALSFVESPQCNSQFLHNESSKLNALLNLFWFEFDNSFFTSEQFIIKDKTDIFLNKRSNFTSNALSQFKPTFLDSKIISNINQFKLFERYESVIGIGQEINHEPSKKFEKGAFGFDSMNRLQRAFYILGIARTTSHLAMKIGFYISVLECLLIVDETELIFRLKVNTANFVGRNNEEKNVIFNTVRDAYNIRSKFFHGAGFNAKFMRKNNFEQISKEMDELVRKVFAKAIEM